jgi:C4-dicarboxylate-specific signal transduction histidine kinase
MKAAREKVEAILRQAQDEGVDAGKIPSTPAPLIL